MGEERDLRYRAVHDRLYDDGGDPAAGRSGGCHLLRSPEPGEDELRLDRGFAGVQGRGGQALPHPDRSGPHLADQRHHGREPDGAHAAGRAGRPRDRGVPHLPAALRDSPHPGRRGGVLAPARGERLEPLHRRAEGTGAPRHEAHLHQQCFEPARRGARSRDTGADRGDRPVGGRLRALRRGVPAAGEHGELLVHGRPVRQGRGHQLHLEDVLGARRAYWLDGVEPRAGRQVPRVP